MIERHKKQLIAAADLGNERLNKRLGGCFEAFAHHMEESIPSTMQDVHQAKAVYRFYENERISYQKLLDAEREASLSGPANQRRPFIQDTIFIKAFNWPHNNQNLWVIESVYTGGYGNGRT